MKTGRKVAIVTGAGSGIGKRVALALLSEGHSVVLAGRRSEPLAAIANDVEVDSSQVRIIPTDVRDSSAIKNLFDQSMQEFGRLDVLFNNAGVFAPPGLLEDLSVEQWQAVVDTNLTGTFLCTQAAFVIMKAQQPRGGRIINNGSVSAHVPRPNSAPYTATKHAVAGLTKSTSLDGRKYNIACSQIDIGNAETEMTQRMKQGILQANGDTLVEPVMDLDHVAQAIVYIANLPLDVNVQFMTVMATKMPYIGRG